MRGPLKIGVLVSGGGTNLQALIDTVHNREAIIVGVGSDVPDAYALERAKNAEIPTLTFPIDQFGDRARRDQRISDWLKELDVELVVLAGYMALLSPEFVDEWSGSIINIHPSLLPAFPGPHAIEDAIEYGAKVFGVTVHVVDRGVDTGPILYQRAIEVPHARTAKDVRQALRFHEHYLLCEAVRAVSRGGVRPEPGHPRRMMVS